MDKKPAETTPLVEKSVAQTTETPPTVVKSTPNRMIWLVGILVVLLVGGSIWMLVLRQPTSIPDLVASPQAKVLTLTIDNPADGTLAVDSEILVSGTTLPNTTLAIYTESDEVIVVSDTYGKFESTVKLISGINSLNIKAFGDDGSEKTASLDIVYDQES